MSSIVWLVFRSMIIGAVAGTVWWLVRGRSNRLPAGAVALLTVLGVGSALIADVMVRLMIGGPSTLRVPRSEDIARLLLEARFVLPLLLGLGAVIVLAFPLPIHTPRRSAELARRTPFTFGRLWWFIGATVIVGTVLTVTVLAGLASEPDEQGLWRLFVAGVPPPFTGGTTLGRLWR